MRRKAQRRGSTFQEALESRRLLASAGKLLQYDFNDSTSSWPSAAASGTAGVTTAVTKTAVGTIDDEGGVTPTGGMNLNASAAPASGGWRATFTSGKIDVVNTVTDLGKLTLGFNLSASQAKTVTLRVVSYNSSGQSTGALITEIQPASAGSYQRYSVDLSTMKPSGSGTFDPTAPKISFNFEIGSTNGWSRFGTRTLKVDNVNYSKPALYVSSINGNNNDDGLTEAAAFATIQTAINASQPGDIICIMGDTAHPYTVPYYTRNLITHGGTPAAWITFKNYPGQTPLIESEGWAAIQIGNYNPSDADAIGYVEVRGLQFHGCSAKVGSFTAPDGNYDLTAPTANQYGPYAKYLQPVDPETGKAGLSAAGTTADPRTNGNGLSIDGGNEVHKPHDIRFADNLIEDFPGGGMGGGDADRLQFENNVIRDNCYWDKYATSGISILSDYSFDGTSGSVTRLIRGNISSGNIHKMKWVRDSKKLTQYSDGNGIIIDYNHSKDGTVTINGRTLVTDNIVFNNGGSGIHSFQSDHVDIVNNTAYYNGASPYLQYGEIFSQGTDTRIYNNILFARNSVPGESPQPVNGGSRPDGTNGIVYKNNVYFGGDSNALKLTSTPTYGAYWPNDNTYSFDNVEADPAFVNATINSAVADFRLQSTSPAINVGLADGIAPQKDLINNVRTGVIDIGAYEYYAAEPKIVTAASVLPTPVTGTAAVLSVIAGDDNGPAGLTYTWSNTAKPTGAPSPTIDANSTSVTKNVTATFYRAGSYTFQATVSDGGASPATSRVTFNVSQTLAGLVVSPSGATVAAGGGTRLYSVSAVDQFGQSMTAPAVTWSTTGSGTSISGGLLTAASTLGAFTVSATGGGLTGTASGTVTDQTPPTLSAAVSRKTHAGAGTFDLGLALTGAGTIEPRSGGANKIVFTFSEPVIPADGVLSANEFGLTNATFASATLSGVTLTLSLTNVINARHSSVILKNLFDSAGNAIVGDVDVSIGNLYGDVNQSGTMSVLDLEAIKAVGRASVNASNFLGDLDLNGTFSVLDLEVIKSNARSILV